MTELKGGLGNQLAQYAAGLALSRRLSLPLVADSRGTDRVRSPEYDQRGLELDAIAHEATFVRSVEEERDLGLDRLPRLTESHDAYDERFEAVDGPVRLMGFWQSPRYWQPVLAELRDQVLAAPSTRVEGAFLVPPGAIGISVRRGDLVRSPRLAEYHGVCSVSYYQRAVQLLRRLGCEGPLRWFSDEPSWVVEHLADNPDDVFSPPAGERPVSGLRLLMGCHHKVLANSSFSYFGGWLSPHAGTVVAPRPAFGPTARHPVRDICFLDWLTIDRRDDLSQP